MAYILDYDYDIFVSYAHVDDMTVPGVKDGWVATLVNNLKILVSQSLGRTDAYSLWMDYRLPGNIAITPAICETIRKSATLTIVLSPGYIASDWCQQEKNIFLDSLEEREEQNPSLFIVEKHKLEDGEYPEEFKDLLGYKFWEQDKTGKVITIGFPIPEPTDRNYYGILTTLATELVNTLKQKRIYSLSAIKSAPPTVSTVEIPTIDLSTKAQNMLQTKYKEQSFDVFLCHNSRDKYEVKEIAEHLMKCGVRPWLDEWELRPGLPWQSALEKEIEKIESAAVFIGGSGYGPWQDMELEAFLRSFVKRESPVIPVVLKSAKGIPQLPVFLRGMTWVDFRKDTPDPLEQLIWGITGRRSIL
jgi:hypothetical protein